MNKFLRLRWKYAIDVVIVLVDIHLPRVIYFVERSKTTEDLTDFLLLKLLSLVIFIRFCLPTVTGRKDHVVNQLSYAWAVCIC